MAAIKNAKIARRAISEDTDILDTIAKEIWQRHNNIEALRQGNRRNSVAKEEANGSIFQPFLKKNWVEQFASSLIC